MTEVAIEKETTSDHGLTIDFNVVSLLVFVTSIIKANYKANQQAYYDAKIAVIIIFLALPIIMLFGQSYKLIINLLGA